MNEFICQGCGAHSFSAASLENLRIKTCEKCGARVAQLGPEPPRKPKIIAVDFDGCLVTNRFPDIGDPIPETIAALKREQESGAKVILWTCRRDDQVKAAAEWCAQHGIHLDAVNRNLPEIVEAFRGDTVKVFANEYWDDRAKEMPPPPSDAALVKDERDTLMKRHHEQVEAIRTRIDGGGLSSDEKRLLADLNFETHYDRRNKK